MIFTIPCHAIPQGRPRFYRLPRGGVRAYDPAKSKKFKELVRFFASTAMKEAVPFEAQIEAKLIFFLPAPKNLAKRLEKGENIAHTKKPDLDNLTKSVLDALTGICYINDSQISKLTAVKLYITDRPYIYVDISQPKHKT